ncbi:MAG TPA: site-specific integrase [Gammaproteobacteria bacterium]|nr:site-specific integrase [Gammaproteobacteria bacterium]
MPRGNKSKSSVELIPVFGESSSLKFDKTPECLNEYFLQLEIDNISSDYQVSKLFLKSYTHSKDTYNVYRREVERFLQWVWRIKKTSIQAVNREFITEYLDFIKKPPASWVGNQQEPRYLDKQGAMTANPKWRPFVISKDRDISSFQFTNNSIKSLLASLSTYFGFLMQENYININPIQQLRQKTQLIRSFQSTRVTRILSAKQWSFIIDEISVRAKSDSQYMRHYFILSMFYLLGVRISELSSDKHQCPMMSDFKCDNKGRWWFQTIGKGNKQREIAIPKALLSIFEEYRISIGLTPLPVYNESYPLIPKLKGQGGIGTRQIHKVVTECFKIAADQFKLLGETEDAERLLSATPHWLRHTSISHDVEHRPLIHVQMDAGHSKISTTSDYVELDYEDRYQSAQSKSLKTEDINER